MNENGKYGASAGEGYLDSLALEVCMSGSADLSSWSAGDRAGLIAEWTGVHGSERRAEFETLWLDGSFAQRVRDLGAFLEDTRGELGAWAAPGAPGVEAVVRRVKQEVRAGRGDLPAGLHGDLVLVGRSFRERLSDSPLLRLVAASLLVHLVALPAVAAYLIFVEKEDPLYVTFDPRPSTALPEPEEPQAPKEILDGEAGGADLWQRLGLETDNALAGARFALRSPGALPAWGGREDSFGAFWRMRLELLKKPKPAAGFAPRPDGPRDVRDALALEVLLDAHVLGAGGAAASEPLQPLKTWVDGVWAWVQAEQDPWARQVGFAVLVRARAYEVFAGSEDFERALTRDGAGVEPLHAGVRPGAPLDRAWLDLVRDGLDLPGGWRALNPGWSGWFGQR